MEPHILDRYNTPSGAASYRKKFTKHWTERLNNLREQRLLGRLLSSLPMGDMKGLVLDMPCGYGRLFPLLRRFAPRVVEADWSFNMLGEAKEYSRQDGQTNLPFGFVRGSALGIPFSEQTFDLVLSVRLCHHISSLDERRDYLKEILRVSNKWVVFTYFDTNSLKNRVYDLRRRINSRRPKWTLCSGDVSAIANAAGFDIAQSVPLSRLFSGHRFTVLRRRANV